MRKRVNRLIAVVVSAMLVATSFSVFTAGAASNGLGLTWPSSPSTAWPSWAQSASTADQTATINAINTEYTNLQKANFQMGNSQGLGDWSGMVGVQFESHGEVPSNNVGNPWSQSGRLWGMITAPYAGMAFSIRQYIAAGYTNSWTPISDQFTWTDPSTSTTKTYQEFQSGEYTQDSSNNVTSSTSNYPGNGASASVQTAIQYAYAQSAWNGVTLGTPAANAQTDASGAVYQEFFGPSSSGVSTQSDRNGKAYGISYLVAANSQATTAYVVTDKIFTAWAAQWGGLSTASPDRFTVSGVPTANQVEASDGSVSQKFTNETIKIDASGKASYSSNNAGIQSFTVSNGNTTFNDTDITVAVPSNTDVTKLAPTITLSDTKATISPASGVAQNFTNPVTYTVTASDGSKKVYTVTVVKTSDADILSFTAAGVNCDIDYNTDTITGVLPAGTDLTSITPVITCRDSSAAVTPAGAQDFSKGNVTYTITSGSTTIHYTVSLRDKSTADLITGFTIPKAQVKYASADLVGAIDNTAETITLTQPYASNLINVTPAVTISDKATVSPASGAKVTLTSSSTYTVTAESGDTKTYKIVVNTAAPAALPHVALSGIGKFNFDDEMSSFINSEALSSAAILNEYNHQRDLGFDLGTATTDDSSKTEASFKNWNDMLNQLRFAGGMGSGTDYNGSLCSYIMMDVPGGLAYTLKNGMLNAWNNKQTDSTKYIDGSDITFSNTGAPATDQFVLDGDTLCQQFTYAYIEMNAAGTTTKVKSGIGIGTSDDNFDAAVKSTVWSSTDSNTAADIAEQARKNIRNAYEYANEADHNPGVALNGNLQYDATTGMVYQVFTGSGSMKVTAGSLADPARSSSDTTIIIYGSPKDSGAGALYGGMLTFWQNQAGDTYKTATLNATVSGQSSDVAAKSFKFNTTIGAPVDSPIVLKSGDIVQDFEHGYITAPNGDFTKAYYTKGARLSSDTSVKSVTLGGVKVLSESYDKANATFTFNVPTSVDLTSVKVYVTPTNANATVDPASGSVMNLSFGSGSFTVTAENKTTKEDYTIVVNQTGNTGGSSTGGNTAGSSSASTGTSGSTSSSTSTTSSSTSAGTSSNPDTGTNPLAGIIPFAAISSLGVLALCKGKLKK